MLGGAASLAAILGFLQSQARRPSRLAPGVEYEARVSLRPKVDTTTAERVVASESGTVVKVTQGRSATFVTFRFRALVPREIVPGETLFQFEGRKATLERIREL